MPVQHRTVVDSRTWIALTLAVLVLLVLPGCKGKGKSFTLQGAMSKMFSSAKPSEMVAMAFDSEDPDKRREGITLLSDRKWGREEPYLKGYSVILRSDPDPRVRSAAVRALGRSSATDYLQDVIKALDDEAGPVRWDAAASLDSLIPQCGEKQGDEISPDGAIGPLSRCALGDPSADVRGSCAAALKHFRNPEVLRTLKGCLRDSNLAVRYRARESLIAILGRDLGADPQDWPDDPDSVRADTDSGENREGSIWRRLFGRGARKRSRERPEAR